MKIIHNKVSIWVTTFLNTSGITLFPFILFKNKLNSDILILHEKIHIKQQIELLVIIFYLWYLIEYLIRIIQYKNVKKGYRNISFEREAYTNSNNKNYLKTRKLFSFLKYLRQK